MPLTIFGDSHDVVPNSARGYTFSRNVGGAPRSTYKLSNVFEEFPSFMRTSAGMISTALHAELVKRGFEHASEAVNEAKKKDTTFQLPEADVNAWGYRLLEREQLKEAIEVFKLNVSLYPESSNTYDSLADGYFAAGDKALAIKNYKRSLELNPKNTHAMERLKELERI